MRQIVAIGGGELREGETQEIDRYIVGLTGKPAPNALFIPTASNDSEEYIAAFEEQYRALGCHCDALRLISGEPNGDRFDEKLRWADLVYVGGGHTPSMVARWQQLGVDRALADAWNRGVVLSGLSAGANCWAKSYNTDAPLIEGRTDVNTCVGYGLGFLPLTLCPHTAREEYRIPEFTQMLRAMGGVGIGIDDCCALHVQEDEYRFLACAPGAVAHKIRVVDGDVRHDRLAPEERFRPLDELMRP